MSKCRGLILGVVMLVALIGAAPALSATATDKKQNKQLKALKKSAASLQSGLDGANAALAGLQSGLAGANGELVKLGGTLASGLQQAAASLATLDSEFDGYVSSPEYGVVQLYFDPEGDGFEANDALPGQLLTSADIPDDGNQSTVTGKLFFAVPNGTSAKEIALKAAIRSGEIDGTGPRGPGRGSRPDGDDGRGHRRTRHHLCRRRQPGSTQHAAADFQDQRRVGWRPGLRDPDEGSAQRCHAEPVCTSLTVWQSS